MTAAVLRTPYADRPPVQQQRRRGRHPRGIVRILDYQRRAFRPGVLAEIDALPERSDYHVNSGRRVRVLEMDPVGFLCLVGTISGLLHKPGSLAPTLDLWIPRAYLRRVWTGGEARRGCL